MYSGIGCSKFKSAGTTVCALKLPSLKLEMNFFAVGLDLPSLLFWANLGNGKAAAQSVGHGTVYVLVKVYVGAPSGGGTHTNVRKGQ